MVTERIKEFMWVKNNVEKLTEDELEWLQERDFFKYIYTNHINLPLPDMIELLYGVDKIIVNHATKED